MKNVEFRSVLREEMASFYAFMKLSIVDHDAYRRTLLSLDSFLHEEGISDKGFDAGLITRWLDTFTGVKPHTKKAKLGNVRKFSGYLNTLGIKTSVPELPVLAHNFEPYTFSNEELARIFETADDLMAVYPTSRIAAEFPMLLRILYGCGLRLGEAASLTWDDIDLKDGTITVRIAKNQKQRLVPMSDGLAQILKLYYESPIFSTYGNGYLFKKADGNSRSIPAYGNFFSTVLSELGIRNPQSAKPGERGPCLHSLRHTFVMNAFLKMEGEGFHFNESVPFVSTYVGHGRLSETDKYLKARHELHNDSHTAIDDYIAEVFPEEL